MAGVRAEFRFDEGRHAVTTYSDIEMAAGVFWTFSGCSSAVVPGSPYG